jgi:phospholipid/cholesterol/gamma-HCH transport system substrate-binding protein
MKISNETKVGVLAAISITILILGYNFLKGEDVFSSSNTYYGVYQKVDGLFRSNPVVVNGYTVGHVSSVEMNDESLELTVAISVPNNIKIPKNSILKITNNDLVGSKAIEILIGQDSMGYAQNGDTLVGTKDAGIEQALTSVLTPLSEKVNAVLANLDTALTDVSLESTLTDLSATLISLRMTTNKLNSILDANAAGITSMVQNLNSMSSDLKSTTPDIKQIIANLDKTSKELASLDMKGLTGDLASTIDELKSTLELLQSDSGSLGKLTHDDALYDNLNKAAASMDLLVKDIMKYPSRYTGFTKSARKKADEKKAAEGN